MIRDVVGRVVRRGATWTALAALVATVAACTGSAPPRSRAQRIGKLEQAIGGPHAIGRIGDFILENDQVRFVIADTGRCPA